MKYETDIKIYDATKNKYRVLGLDEPVCTCVFENEEFLVLKFPPHKGWVHRGEYKNYPTKYGIFWKKLKEIEF